MRLISYSLGHILAITSLEMLSVLSNTQVLFAHLIGLLFSLWLLQRIYRTS